MQTILIIEDEDPVRHNLRDLLSAEGYLPIEARDGEEGVRLAWEYLPDLILCDITMPRLDGFGVLSRLIGDPATVAIPFIFLTARTDRDHQRRGMSLGADDYIMKPFTIDDVLQAIHTRLEKRALVASQVEKKAAQLSKHVRLALPGEMLTSISLILSYSEMLADRVELNRLESNQVWAMGQEIHRSAGILLRSIQNSMLYNELEMIRLDANRMRALQDSRVLSAWMAITEMAALKARQDRREADLRLNVDNSPLRISEMYLQKIVEELLDNAFKFSPAGTPVEVSGEVRADRKQYFLRVADQGRGMAADQVIAVLGRMPGAGRRADYTGQGLGLAIVRRLVDLHDGSFNVQSQPKQWTVVEVSVPLSD